MKPPSRSRSRVRFFNWRRTLPALGGVFAVVTGGVGAVKAVQGLFPAPPPARFTQGALPAGFIIVRVADQASLQATCGARDECYFPTEHWAYVPAYGTPEENKEAESREMAVARGWRPPGQKPKGLLHVLNR